MTRLTTIVATLALVVASAACTKISTSTGPGAKPGEMAGIVRIAITSEPNSLNPALASLYAENYVEEAIFSGLVKLDGAENLVPDLAIAVPSRFNGGISADGRTLTYHLRRRVFWHDGRPLTADDVVFTYRTLTNPKTNAPLQSLYRAVQSVEARDPYTVVVRLKTPSAPAVGQLFCNGLSGQILPKHLLERSADVNRDPFGLQPVGSGPFIFEHWDRGSRIMLKPNPQYFDGAPRLKEIDIQIVPDPNTLLTLVRSREVDVARIRPSQRNSTRTVAGIRTAIVPSYGLDFITFNVTHPPFDDARVRRALAFALDRQKIAKAAFSGAAIFGDSLIPPYSWAYAPDNETPRFDPQAAATLLDRAGWTLGSDGVRRHGDRRLSFELVTFSGRGTSASMAQQIQAQWRAIGVDAAIHPIPVNVLVGTTGLLSTGKFDVALDDLFYDIDPDRALQLSRHDIPPHGFNDSRYSSAQMERWLEAAVRTYDRRTRTKYYALVQRLANRDLPYIPLAWEPFVYALNADLRNFRPETVNSDLWNVQDWSM